MPASCSDFRVEHDLVLEAHGFRLEPLAQQHVSDLARMVDADLWAGMSAPLPVGEVGMMNYIEDALALPGCLPFAVVDLVDGQVRGSTALVDHHPEARRVEIGRTFYDRAVWGRVINPASKFLLLQHAFEGLGVYRVALRADARNTRSLGAIERLGATREGLLRGYRDDRDGTRVDSVSFSILEPEWPEIRERLLNRLDPLRSIEASMPPLASVGASVTAEVVEEVADALLQHAPSPVPPRAAVRRQRRARRRRR